jgi:hypothetical protein
MALAALCSGTLLSGCFTGERPSISTDPFIAGSSTGDALIDAVLTKMDAVEQAPPTFTAGYQVLTRFGNTTHQATVTVEGNRRVITVGDVRYVQTPSVVQTCVSGACTNGFDPARISDTSLTVDFYATDTAKKLRIDAAAKIGPTKQTVESIAGLDATCVAVQQSNNVADYCVLDDGVLGRLDDADLQITLTSFSSRVDPAVFAPG